MKEDEMACETGCDRVFINVEGGSLRIEQLESIANGLEKIMQTDVDQATMQTAVEAFRDMVVACGSRPVQVTGNTFTCQPTAKPEG